MYIFNKFLDSHAEGTILNITRVNREHMGVYRSATAKCTKLLLRKEYTNHFVAAVAVMYFAPGATPTTASRLRSSRSSAWKCSVR